MISKIIFEFFKQHNVKYRLFEHQPVFTVDDNPIVTAVDGIVVTDVAIPKPHFKTLFLKDKDGKFFLISVIEDKRVNLNALSMALGCGRFSFGKAEELLDLMSLIPGSVTPFGLIFDKENKITFVLDEDASNHQFVSFHPMRNDMTVVLTGQDFMDCMGMLGHRPLFIKIPIKI